MADIQDLQNKVNSLSHMRVFYDLESGRSSGATHVPSQTILFWVQDLSALRFWSAAWCTELYGYHRKRFQPPSAQEGLSSTILNKFKEYGIIFSGIEALDHRNCKEERVKWKENRGMRRFFYTISKIEVVCWIKVVELSLTVVWWIFRELRLRKCILENFLTLWNFEAGNSSSELRFV